MFKTKPPAPNSSDGAAKPVGQDSGGAKPAESGGEAVAAQQGAADDAHTLEDECRSIEEKVAVLDSLTSALEELGRHQAEMQAIQELASGLMAVQEGDTAQGAARSPSPTGVLSSKHPGARAGTRVRAQRPRRSARRYCSPRDPPSPPQTC